MITTMKVVAWIGLALVLGCGDDGNGDESGNESMMPASTSGSGSTETSVDPTEEEGTTSDNGESGDASTSSGGMSSGGSSSTSDDGSSSTTMGVDLDTCLDRVDNVVFDNTPPPGETRVPSLGTECIDLLGGEDLWNYHCRWCHSTLDNNDINDRTAERVLWAVTTSEGLGNWPEGDLADNQAAQDRILDAIIASPPPVPDHPHPLPKYE